MVREEVVLVIDGLEHGIKRYTIPVQSLDDLPVADGALVASDDGDLVVWQQLRESQVDIGPQHQGICLLLLHLGRQWQEGAEDTLEGDDEDVELGVSASALALTRLLFELFTLLPAGLVSTADHLAVRLGERAEVDGGVDRGLQDRGELALGRRWLLRILHRGGLLQRPDLTVGRCCCVLSWRLLGWVWCCGLRSGELLLAHRRLGVC